jgi:multidrug efflux pump subunit AcrB
MRDLLKWAIKNGPGVNVMVLGTLLAGIGAFLLMRREIFPEFQLEVILVSVPYPGASPEEVEKGICQQIEEEVRSLAGIKKLVSIAREGGGYTLIELTSSVRDPQKVLSEVRSAVDRKSPFFPRRAEKATVEQITFRTPAIRLAVIGPDDSSPEAEYRLRQVAEEVRDRVLDLKEVSQAQMLGAKPFQIDVEVAEETLRKFGLSLNQISQILRRQSIETPGGQLRTEGQEILLRGKNKRETREEIERLPVISQDNGVVLTVSDIAEVKDEFDDVTAINEVNGQPAMVISIDRTADEDIIKISDSVRQFASQHPVPSGYTLRVWGDESIDVRDRMSMLAENGTQGAIIVFVMLALFLDLRLAFWVSMGIPISVMGAGIVLLMTGQTLNMLSMFAFLMAVGIVVDDGIVIGENIYTHRLMGKSFRQAAIDGATEVLPSVFSSVATTVVAFMPLFYVSGVMGKFIAVMPVAIIAMLLISLTEATFALPGHLSHAPKSKPDNLVELLLYVLGKPFRPIVWLFDLLRKYCTWLLDWVAESLYKPTLELTLRYPLIPISVAVTLFVLAIGLVRSGTVPFNAFPKLDGKTILCQVSYPDGTPPEIADEATRRVEQAIRDVGEAIYQKDMASKGKEDKTPPDPLNPRGPVKLTFRQVGQSTGAGAMGSTQNTNGSHVGQVQVELVDAAERSVTSEDIIAMWRQAAGEFPGAERVVFDSANMGPGGAPLEFKVLAPSDQQAQLETVVERCKKELATYAGVFDIRDDSSPGKVEFQIRIKENASSLGITDEELSETIRAAYYGAEVMRLQRGRNEVKLMVRYPKDERRSLANFEDIRIRGSDGGERPISELADIQVTRGYSEINRLDQYRAITVTANLDENVANSQQIIGRLKTEFMPKVESDFRGVQFRWEGQAQNTQESITSLGIGFAVAILVMYVLLVLEFHSYFQPFLILVIIPFGIIGAVFGHALMGLPLTLFSMFGLVSLTGVVVNDSIVLLDFINQKMKENLPIKEVLREAGVRRLRPVFLTSITTIAGLLPMLLEKSLQAQALIPMATSLAFGLMMTTFLVLYQMPNLYWFYVVISGWFGFDVDKQRLQEHRDEVEDGAKETESLPQPSLA